MPADVETPANTKTPGFNNYITVEYNDGSGSQQYRTYLNGGTILVAYEFKVSAVGVYVIGSAHGSEATASNLDCPMEIVHFSVSGTADEGNDGVSGSKLGTVDFVYQTDGQIITVGTTNAAYTEEENYVNYYASRVYLFTANDYIPSGTEYVNLSSFKIEVYRCIDTGNDPNRTMVLYAYGSEGQRILLQLTRYSSYSDATEISHASAPGAP